MQTKSNIDIARQRQQAKLGMTVALGALVATGLLSRMQGAWTQGARTMHLCSGVALVGFSYWHLTLYQQNARMRGHSA
jgi:thiosulfate reductase cytochrome b subunit